MKSKIFIKIKKFIKTLIQKLLKSNTTTLDLVEVFPAFLPSSAGSYKMYEDSIIQNINSILPTLSAISSNNKKLEILNVDDLNFSNSKVNLLDSLFKKFKSDKSTKHDYHKIYASYIKDKNEFTLVEIGLGTNNLDVISNMSSSGVPGASLYAFSEAYPNSTIIGCDIDKRILFNEGNIQTYYLDQNVFSSYSVLSKFKGKIDFLIDDGLHAQNANLNTLLFALENLKNGGVLFIEDIPEYAIDTWQIVYNILPENYEFKLIKSITQYCGVLKKVF